MEELSSKKLIVIIVLLVAIAFGSGVLIGKTYFAKGSEEIIETEAVKENITPIIKTIKVYVAGEVKKPDVYELDDGAIVKDAILLAGGFTENADTISINLAKKLTDGEEVIVYSKIADINGSTGIVSNTTNTNSSPNRTGKININTASKEELMTLSGIGEVKAQAIIDYRTKNGPFKDTHEIVNVSGIGEKTFEKIKDSITT